MEGEAAENPTLSPSTVGEKLRAAREAQGLDISEVASRTRIPQRHLEAIEQSNFTGLPSITYALGFAKAYARAVGADEVETARELRMELGDHPERAAPTPSYEMSDPTRVPPPWLAWGGALIAVLVLVGVALWYGTGLFRGSAPATADPLEVIDANANVVDNGSIATDAGVPASGGQVTLVATDTVWIRVNDASGARLFEKELAPGERYDVPANADRPSVRTGRPDRIQVLLNGSQLPPLGTGAVAVTAEVSAAALQARGQANSTPTPAASPLSSAGSVTARPPAQPAPRATPAVAPVEAPAGNTAANP